MKKKAAVKKKAAAPVKRKAATGPATTGGNYSVVVERNGGPKEKTVYPELMKAFEGVGQILEDAQPMLKAKKEVSLNIGIFAKGKRIMRCFVLVDCANTEIVKLMELAAAQQAAATGGK